RGNRLHHCVRGVGGHGGDGLVGLQAERAQRSGRTPGTSAVAAAITGATVSAPRLVVLRRASMVAAAVVGTALATEVVGRFRSDRSAARRGAAVVVASGAPGPGAAEARRGAGEVCRPADR